MFLKRRHRRKLSMHRFLRVLSTGTVAATVVAAGLQAGTASASTVQASNKPIEITYAGFSSMNGLAPGIINKLNKQYAGKYIFKATPYPYNNYAALLSAAIAGGNTPDLFGASWTPSVYYAREGLELPIEPFVKKAGINTADFPAGMYGKPTLVNGVNYSIPLDAFGTALFYNKAYFKKAGLNPAHPPKTGAQLIADALAMKKAGIKYPVIMGADKTTQDFLYPSLVYQFGGVMGDAKTCGALFDSKAGIAAATWEKNLIYKYKVAPQGPSVGEDLDEFGKGAVGMVMLPAINQGAYIKDLGANLGVAPLPKIGTANDKDFVGQQYLWVFKTTASTTPQGAQGVAILLKAIYDQELKTIAIQNGIIPTYSPVLGAVQKTMPFFAQQNYMVQHGVINPAIPNWGTVTGVPLYNNLDNVLLNRVPVSVGVHEAAVQTNELTKTLPGCSD
jgi:multiple sugar transport system substrate-binding protein